jgi:hypothetical protein
VPLLDQQLLGGVADRLRQRGGRQIAVEGIFVLLVIGMNGLADLVGGRARRDEGRLQARRPRLQRQHDFADVAGYDNVDFVFIDCALERSNRVCGRGVIVIRDDFDLAAADSALGVDLVGSQLGGLRNGRPGDGLGLRDDADLDRVRRARLRGGHGDEGKSRRS